MTDPGTAGPGTADLDTADLDTAVLALARTPTLLIALDFDGVLAPIVDVPAAARPLPASASAIGSIATLPGTTVALVSGRGLADLAAVSGFGAPVRLVGSHGGEFDDGVVALDDAARARLERLTTELEQLVADEPGVKLEYKPNGLAVHVRGADPTVAERVLTAVWTGPAAAAGIESTPGKSVLDLAVVAVTKGSAVRRLRVQTAADAVLYVGDDITDETAFAVLEPGDVGVKVGDGETAASYRVADPTAVADLLEALRTARSRRD